MLFEVWKDGRRIACTDHQECIPDARRIAELKKAGYKIKTGANKKEVTLCEVTSSPASPPSDPKRTYYTTQNVQNQEGSF